MKLITTDEYNHITMQVARPILDRHQRILLGAGKKIHPKYMLKLNELDIKYIFVEDAESWDVTLEEVADMPTWIDAVNEVKEVFESADIKGSIDIRKLSSTISKIEDEVKKRKILIPIPTTALPSAIRRYAHTVNVTMLSLMIAKKKKFNGMQTHELAMGCVLHDIGKNFTNIHEDHTKVGFDFLRKIREVSVVSAHIAYQHHERYDGQGFPRGLKDKEVHEYAQICGIANLYDNLISVEGTAPHDALEVIMTSSGTIFTQEIVQIFVETIPTYYPGTRVELNNKREGIITKINSNLHRPIIRYLDTNEELSLVNETTLLVSKVLPSS
ncbi:MAG: c-di-GMP phosphodiesterase [Bacillales bacterium]|jgi:putative nucleotidyltransferase with HDIG domain|nr:c-di-GMP phosphodiesterase [Bacillales bacterium]